MNDNFDIRNIPEEFKKWRSLSEYNREWIFVSYNVRYRIAEHLSALDYLFSLYLWLKPVMVFDDLHKRLVLIIAASIYECILNDAIYITVERELSNTKLIKKFISKDKINNLEKDEFEKIINNANEANIINDDWKDYLHRIREVRNWIHLSKERDANLESWFQQQTIDDLRNKLNEFRLIIESFYSNNNLPF